MQAMEREKEKQRVSESTPNRTGKIQVMVRVYDTVSQYEADAQRLIPQGWRIEQQSQGGGHVNIGRTTTGAVLTGGLSLLFGGSRTKDKLTVTWRRDPE